MSDLPVIIEQNQDKFLAVMENPEKFERIKNLFLSQVSANKALQSCSPASMLGSLKKLATYDLDLTDPNSAFLVPYKGEASLQIGYKGLQQIFLNKGGKKVFAETVYADDDFEIDLESQEIKKHTPGVSRMEEVAYYGVAIMANGEKLVAYMTKDQMIEQSKKSMSDKFWKKSFKGMAEKTMIRKVLNKIPQAKITYIDAPEVEIGRREFGLQSNEEIIEAETSNLGLE